MTGATICRPAVHHRVRDLPAIVPVGPVEAVPVGPIEAVPVGPVEATLSIGFEV